MCAGLLAVTISGCQSPATRREELNSTYAPTRARAVVASAEAGDATAIHKLVDLLADEDRGVRMYAIVALRRLCGVDFGYRYYAPEVERQAAVDRWREAIRSGEVHMDPRGVARDGAADRTGVSAEVKTEGPCGAADGEDGDSRPGGGSDRR